MRAQRPTSPRPRLHWAVLWFMVGYLVLLAGVSWFYLLPALAVAQEAGPEVRQRLGVVSLLLLAVLLAVLIVGLMLVFRARRFFISSEDARSTTRYSDAWSESSRRTRE